MSRFYKNYELGATRMYSEENVKAWAKAEKNLGLTKSIFITIKGTTTQYYNIEEGKRFYENVKNDLKVKGRFDFLCERYLKAFKDKNRVIMFEVLTVFNELDEHPELFPNEATELRYRRFREEHHEEIYKLR